MSLAESLIISISLAMDAFAVSVCKGLSMKKRNYKKCIIIGYWFGLFQGVMPAIGFLLGSTFEKFITVVDHWIAFVLLLLIGFSMIKETFSKESEEQTDDTSFFTMLVLSIATSIDALAVGIAYVCGYGSTNAIKTFFLIGIITFLLSSLGVIIGNKFGSKLSKKAELMGGFVLVCMGIKILIEHLGII